MEIGNSIDTGNPAADKKRKFNLITVKKNDKSDIIASLSIDFLFYLKELGNKFDHLDESILNYILFSDLTIIEENELEYEENKKEPKEMEINEKTEGKEKINDIAKQKIEEKPDNENFIMKNKNGVIINKSDKIVNSNNTRNDSSKKHAKKNSVERASKIEKSKEKAKKISVIKVNTIEKNKENGKKNSSKEISKIEPSKEIKKKVWREKIKLKKTKLMNQKILQKLLLKYKQTKILKKNKVWKKIKN